MKKALAICCAVLICTSCGRNNKDFSSESKRNIEVVLNRNIHASHMIELLVWPGEYPTRPMVINAQEHIMNFKNHPAILLSDSLLQNEIFYFDELTEVLLYMEALPSTTFKHSLESSPYRDRIDILTRWTESIAELYIDANLDSFFDAHENYYLGAIDEVTKNLPDIDFVTQIESYYRDKRLKYTIIPAPEMPTGGAYGQRGIGPYVYTNNGLEIYQVISASLPVEFDSSTQQYEEFGFDYKEFVLRNSFHEFGHAFVNPVLEKEKNRSLIYEYEYLFTDELKEVMLVQNYDNWLDCIAEHLVRLGEIRLASRSGKEDWAEKLRHMHVREKAFILIPYFEEKIIEYENDRNKGSFEEYLPELLRALEPLNQSNINNDLKCRFLY